LAKSGDFALYVRADGTAVFLGFLGGAGTGLAATNLVVDLSGNFSLNLTTTAAAASSVSQLFPAAEGSILNSQSDEPPILVPPTDAAPQSVTLRGLLDDTTGTVSATVPELALTLTGTRAANTGPATAQAGFYSGALVGSAAGRGYVIVGADGQAFVFAANGSNVAALKTTLGANGRIFLPEPDVSIITYGFLALDLGLARNALSGTVHIIREAVATLDGAADALAGTEHLANLSARGGVAPGAPLIAGFVITGPTPKQVLIRAAGPALAAAPFNLPGTLDDPALQLFRGNTVLAQNDNWGAPAASAAAISAAAASVNAFPFRAGSADAALLTTLAPGAYTVQVAGGAASVDGTGAALVEIYEILQAGEAPGARRLANLSARGPVAPGVPFIVGFVINGTAPQRVLVRGTGPALAAFAVPGALANPVLTLFRGSTVIKTNDDWFRDPDAALIRDAAAKSGAFPLGTASLDAALLLYLDPGAYTAQVSGAANGTGIALIEVYEAAP
jgi:hypothetical protein